MMRTVRRTSAAAAAAALTCLALALSGCSAQRTGAPASPAATTAPVAPRLAGTERNAQPADAARLTAAQAAFAAAPGQRLTGALQIGDLSMKVDVTVSADGSDWAGTLTSPGQELELRHTQATTWVSAPADYWRAAGISDEAARKAGRPGRFLAFSREAASQVVSYADFTAFVQTVGLLDPAMATKAAAPADAPDDLVLIIRKDRAVNWLVVTGGATPRFRSMIADNGNGSASTIHFTPLDAAPVVEVPAASQVVPLTAADVAR